jgi:hypothetical protein
VLNAIMGNAVTGATRDALIYAIVVVTVGTGLSFLVPSRPGPEPSLAEDFAALVPIDPEAVFESEPGSGGAGVGHN